MLFRGHGIRRGRRGLRLAVFAPLALMMLAGAALMAQPDGKATDAKPITPPAGAKAPETPAKTDGAASPSTIDSSGKLPTFRDLFEFSPVFNGIIIGLSVVAVLLFIYFMLTINTRTMMPPGFLDEVTKLVIAGRYDEAAQFCRSQPQIFCASILQRCLENADKDPGHLLALIESEGQRKADLVWNRISYLMDLSSLGPMVGLLGTVHGMLEAFFVLGTKASPGSKAMASSIGQAMTATFLGLAVAILAVVFHSIIKSRTIATLADVEQVVHSIADHVKRPSVPASAQGGGR